MMRDQSELDKLSTLLAPLSVDELCVTIANSRLPPNPTPMLAAISFLNLISTLAMMVEDQDRDRIAHAMTDIAELLGGRDKHRLN